MEKNRLEAFSDGVFAVAITLLVLDLLVPKSGSGRLWAALEGEWAEFASYAVSFMIIGIIWVNHHSVFARLRRVDRPLMYLNLLLLMSVVVIPFATQLLARYIEGGANSHTAAAVYSVVSTFMAVCFGFIWVYIASHRQLLEDPENPEFAWKNLPRFAGGVVLYILTVGVAFLSAIACLIIQALLALYYVFDQISTRTFDPDEAEGVAVHPAVESASPSPTPEPTRDAQR